MKNTYTLSYNVKDNPNYDYEEQFDNAQVAIKRACQIQNMFDIDGVISVFDDDGDIVVEVE